VTTWHKSLRTKFATAIRTRCSKDRCHIDLTGLRPPPIILDGEAYRDAGGCDGKICDYLIFPIRQEIVAVVAEMKSGSVDVSRAVEQLKGAALHVDILAGKRNVKEFFPLIVSGNIRHASEVKALRGSRVQFRGKSWDVIRERCGARLDTILTRFTI
jgi:hypothetical protein